MASDKDNLFEKIYFSCKGEGEKKIRALIGAVSELSRTPQGSNLWQRQGMAIVVPRHQQFSKGDPCS